MNAITSKAVPIPARMAKLDRDRRGLPVPVIVVRDKAGIPHFAVNEIDAMQACVDQDRCQICGDRLTRGRWLIGGPLSAFAERGKFGDGPMHFECAGYALRVCPYLAARNYGGIDKVKELRRAGVGIGFDIDPLDPRRPQAFVAVMSVAVDIEHPDLSTWLYQPRPGSIRRIDVWRQGALLDGVALAEFKANAKAALACHDQPARHDMAAFLQA